MMFRRLILTLPLLALIACQTPQEMVFASRAVHNEALRIAVAYSERPSCMIPMAPVVCARADVVERIVGADAVATIALDAAEKTVRTPGFGEDVYRSAAVAAKAAVDAFLSIIDLIKE